MGHVISGEGPPASYPPGMEGAGAFEDPRGTVGPALGSQFFSGEVDRKKPAADSCLPCAGGTEADEYERAEQRARQGREAQAGGAQEGEHTWQVRPGPISLRVQFVEQVRKRVLCLRRDPKSFFYEVPLPGCMLRAPCTLTYPRQVLLPVCMVALVLLILEIVINPAGPSLALQKAKIETCKRTGCGAQEYFMAHADAEPRTASEMPWMDALNLSTSCAVGDHKLLPEASAHSVGRFGTLVFDDEFPGQTLLSDEQALTLTLILTLTLTLTLLSRRPRSPRTSTARASPSCSERGPATASSGTYPYP